MKQFLLWTLSVILMIAFVFYQRTTGPTYDYRGKLTLNGKEIKYKLVRSHETTSGAKVQLPLIDADIYTAVLHYKRYPTMDSITSIPFTLSEDSKFIAQLPVQPAAGKMEYFITGNVDGVAFRIPEDTAESIILRYKDPVPSSVLIPHIVFMFLAIVFGIRAGLSALVDTPTMRKWAIVSLIGVTIGGMILGPIVQNYAFGAYWTGFPFGGDLTDNKTLIMWLVWIIALAIIGFKPKKNETISRVVVFVAATVMTAAYLIPHSLGGSTLDYSKVDQGIDPKEAVTTGVRGR